MPISQLLEDVSVATTNLSILKHEDWYIIPRSHLVGFSGRANLTKHTRYASVKDLVCAAIPHHPWQPERFAANNGISPRLALQAFAQRLVTSLFPASTRILSNWRADLVPEKGRALEVDIYLPQYNLGFEYQEVHHYFSSHFGRVSLAEYQEKDEQKDILAQKCGMTLIKLPFWWDFKRDSLVATIQSKRPELLLDVITEAQPISEAIPDHINNHFKNEVPGLGVPALVLHAPAAFNPANWWIFEKYDGVRAIWNASERTLFSRTGNEVALPKYLQDSIPSAWLDGELWLGHETLTEACKVVTANFDNVKWEALVYMIFDTPESKQEYRYRWGLLKQLFSRSNIFSFVRMAPHVLCNSVTHAESIYHAALQLMCEGIVARESSSMYHHGYSHTIYKYKKFKDHEALVIRKGSGINTWICKVAPQPGSNEVVVSMSLHPEFVGNIESIVPGSIVSFKHIGNHGGSGTPVNPKIYCVRQDIRSWGDLMELKKNAMRPKLAPTPLHKPLVNNKWDDEATRRKFFDKLAVAMKFDPLDADNWYKVKQTDITQYKGGTTLISYYKSHSSAIMHLYPELGLSKHKFETMPKRGWADLQVRKNFFEQLLNELKIAPSTSQQYYISRKDVLKRKGGRAVLLYHNDSHLKALKYFYPDLNLVPAPTKTKLKQ